MKGASSSLVVLTGSPWKPMGRGRELRGSPVKDQFRRDLLPGNWRNRKGETLDAPWQEEKEELKRH